jgi:polyisoprenoid-binding protein YceI
LLSRRIVILLLLAFGLGALVGGVAGVFIFIRIAGGTGEPSAPISAPTLALDQPDTSTDDLAPVATQVAYIAAQVDSLATAAADGNIEAQVTVSATAQVNTVLFRIVPDESEARFIVDERRPFIIGLVGRTDQVAGDILVDFDQPSDSRVGTIRINLRTLQTDDADRDSSIRGAILLSAQPQYEFTDFTPTGISGLPQTVTIGEPITFQVTGDLPLRGVTRSVTFDVTVTPVSQSELNGLARTTIQRADYGLLEGGLIEHGVSEDVVLELEFVARTVESQD